MQTNTDPWFMVDELIKSFIANNPDAWANFQMEMTAIRMTRANPKFADSSDKNSAHRWSASFPNGENGVNLLTAIEKVDTKLFKDKKRWTEFLNRHPEFRVPLKV